MKIKKKSTALLLIIPFLLAACSEKKASTTEGLSTDEVIHRNDLNEMEALKKKLSAQQHNLAEQLGKLTDAIDALDSNKSIPLVSIYEIKTQRFKHYIEVQANFHSDKNIELFAEYNGLLTKVLIREGDRVKKGQVLAQIDDGGLSQQLTQAEVQEGLAKTTYERQKKLWNQDVGSEMQYLQAKANYEAQTKIVAQLRAQMSKTKIKAPFDAVVDEIMVEEGNMVMAGGMNAIMRLMNLDEVYVKADVPENYIKSIKKGTEAIISIPVLNDTLITTISQVGNFIKADNRTFRVEAVVENNNWDIKPNMNAKLTINNYISDSAIVIPQNVITECSNGEQKLSELLSKLESLLMVI